MIGRRRLNALAFNGVTVEESMGTDSLSQVGSSPLAMHTNRYLKLFVYHQPTNPILGEYSRYFIALIVALLPLLPLDSFAQHGNAGLKQINNNKKNLSQIMWLTTNRLRLTSSVTAFLFSENRDSVSSFVDTSRPFTCFELVFVWVFCVPNWCSLILFVLFFSYFSFCFFFFIQSIADTFPCSK